MRYSKGFTLIELLVVIAIIALLLAIVLPALGKAKAYAQEVICKTNLHQYHLATEMYANDYNEKFPNPAATIYKQVAAFSGEANTGCRWHNPQVSPKTDPERFGGPYWPYLDAGRTHVCPTFKKIAPKYGGAHSGSCIGAPFEVQYSYSMNHNLRNATDTDGVRKNQIASPTQTFLWAEENMWTLKDRSSQAISNSVLNDTALLASYPQGDTASIIDSFGSFHKISAAKLAAQQPGAGGGYGIYADQGVSNVLFVDGSLTTASPLETKRYEGRVRR